MCTLLSASFFILHNELAFFHSPAFCFSTQPPQIHRYTMSNLYMAQRFSLFPLFLTFFMMIDQYSPKQLGSSMGKPIKSFQPSIKQQGEGNIPNTTPCCLFLSPRENRLIWQSAGGSPSPQRKPQHECENH